VVVAGINTYIELWNPEDWNKEREQVEGENVDIDGWAALGI
jgi:DNA-binding transcriptional regulator/RsmH inhibitor MraZ